MDVNNQIGDIVLGTTVQKKAFTQSAYVNVSEQYFIAASKSN